MKIKKRIYIIAIILITTSLMATKINNLYSNDTKLVAMSLDTSIGLSKNAFKADLSIDNDDSTIDIDNEQNVTEDEFTDFSESDSTVHSQFINAEEQEMVNLINEQRRLNGFKTLTFDSNLYNAACQRVNEIPLLFSHTRPDGTPFYTISPYIDGENLSKYGRGDAQSSFTGFMNSSDHRENILYSNFNRVACKKIVVDDIVYWIQAFGY